MICNMAVFPHMIACSEMLLAASMGFVAIRQPFAAADAHTRGQPEPHAGVDMRNGHRNQCCV